MNVNEEIYNFEAVQPTRFEIPIPENCKILIHPSHRKILLCFDSLPNLNNDSNFMFQQELEESSCDEKTLIVPQEDSNFDEMFPFEPDTNYVFEEYLKSQQENLVSNDENEHSDDEHSKNEDSDDEHSKNEEIHTTKTLSDQDNETESDTSNKTISSKDYFEQPKSNYGITESKYDDSVESKSNDSDEVAYRLETDLFRESFKNCNIN